MTNGSQANCTLDPAAGLTRVLSDGTNTCLHGASRLAQQSVAGMDYSLGDAVGSGRQLADSSGAPQSVHGSNACRDG